ncbi:MAG: hypothetical protein DMD85_08025 [Candidatus Rokuibacteriota bacterium]|nr:MAG: hypothetical protein DMD85_08025 [Candidatus Rokubacteria bacterium]
MARDGAIHVNVHVGGVARSRDGGTSWTPTMDIEQDVHQVTAHPRAPEIVVVASAEGFGISRNGGDSWSFATAGLHAHYCRAVAVAGDHVLVSAATGFRGPAGRLVVFGTADGRLYRSRDAGTGWELALKGLPRVGCVALG